MGQGALWKKDGIENYRSDDQDYDGRLEEPFFKYVKRSKDYDQNEVPWPDKRGAEPVQVQISAYLRFASNKIVVNSTTNIIRIYEYISFVMDVFDCSRNVLKVDEPSQLLTVETSLRMTWKDSRLAIILPGDYPTSYIRFGNNVMSYIWIPDVYIDGVQDLRSPAYKVNLI